MAKIAKRARIQLLKSILVDGKHTPAGSKLELDRYKASELIGAGQAKSLDDEDEADRGDDRKLEDDEGQLGVKIETPTHHDPGVKTLEHADARGPAPKLHKK